MKFLCLHGAIGNASNFRVQLDPICRELESDGSCEFKFISGQHQIHGLPSDFANYYGPGPHYRFLDDGGRSSRAMLERIRDFPESATPEDALRALVPTDVNIEDIRFDPKTLAFELGRIFDIIDADPEIEGIMGYSEGAGFGASLMVEDKRRWEEEGCARRLKCGVFFAGWPPLGSDGYAMLSDMTDYILDVPSVHVIGARDPYLSGALSLYNICDEDSATLFDHGRGHTLPRDARTVKELGDTIRQTIAAAAGLSDAWSTPSDSMPSTPCE